VRHLFRAAPDERLAFQRRVQAAGLELPLVHRVEWLRAHSSASSWLVGLEGDAGDALGAIGVTAIKPRILPGAKILRAERLPEAVPPFLIEQAADALSALGTDVLGVIELRVEVFSRSPEERGAVAGALERRGYVRCSHRRVYKRTLIIDLESPEEELFASLHRSTRRDIRKAERSGHVIRQLEDPAYANRIDALFKEAMARTNGPYDVLPWRTHLAFSSRFPELSRIVGFFADGREDERALMGFNWCGLNGRGVEYLASGAGRELGAGVSINHWLLWDQVRWAKSLGVRYFDCGGVTAADQAEDPVRGISDFKRRFGGTEVWVGDEWCKVLRPAHAKVIESWARARNLVRRVRRLRGWGRGGSA
jgi:hypothetical protein